MLQNNNNKNIEQKNSHASFLEFTVLRYISIIIINYYLIREMRFLIEIASY